MLGTLKQLYGNKWKRVHYKPHRQNFHSTHCLLLNVQNLSFTVDQIHLFSQGAHTSCGFEIWFHVATSKVPAQICRFYGNLTIFTSASKATQSYKIKHTWMCLKIWFSVIVAILSLENMALIWNFDFLKAHLIRLTNLSCVQKAIGKALVHYFFTIFTALYRQIRLVWAIQPVHYTLHHVARAKKYMGRDDEKLRGQCASKPQI